MADPYTGRHTRNALSVSRWCYEKEVRGQEREFSWTINLPTLVTGDPAVSFSTKRSIPSRPNAEVALRHPLFPLEGQIDFSNGVEAEYEQ